MTSWNGKILKIFKILLDKSKVLWYNTSKVKGTPQRMTENAVRGGQEAVKGLGLRKIFYIPESVVVPEGSSPKSGLGWLLRSHWGKLQVVAPLIKILDEAVGGHRPYRWVKAYSHQTSNDNALSVSQGQTEGHRWVKEAIPINA